MKILVINAGSSSIKYQLIDTDTDTLYAKGICERIGGEGSLIEHKQIVKGLKVKKESPMRDHADAMKLVIKYLTDAEYGCIKDMSEIEAIGHRVVHGGEKFTSSTLLTAEAMAAIEECNDLAPLHNPANLIGIRACQELMPNVPMVAVFDTSFHQSMEAGLFPSKIRRCRMF